MTIPSALICKLPADAAIATTPDRTACTGVPNSAISTAASAPSGVVAGERRGRPGNGWNAEPTAIDSRLALPGNSFPLPTGRAMDDGEVTSAGCTNENVAETPTSAAPFLPTNGSS